MHRDPRLADVERLLGQLTTLQGVGMGVGKFVGMPSRLLETLAMRPEFVFVEWLWIALFVGAGVTLYGASTLYDIKLRICALYGCAGIWLLTGVVSLILKLPGAIFLAWLLVFACLKAARRIRNG